mmetsp:Transcript_26263/g.44687  ORF Transcript_26263/g.44687 Transcript_26263/m.44687 type:complete len:527 (-) Transcript_26263:49-1629(-)
MWPQRTPSRAILPAFLALSALAAIITTQDTIQPIQRQLSNAVTDPKSSSLRSGSGSTKTYTDLVNEDAPLPQYSLENVINAANIVQSRYALLRYDPASDKFTAYYSDNHLYVSGCAKLSYAIRQLTMIMRTAFPDRFTPDSSELVLAIEAGDYPDVMPYRVCVVKNLDAPCNKKLLTAAPVLAFGSTFAKPMFPNMIGMPMPGEHLTCFLRWATRKEVCPFFGEHTNPASSLLTWDELKPQLVWRGTDFNFISIQKAHERPKFENYYAQGETDPSVDQHEAATAMLKQHFSKLLPRWQGAVLTAESEIEARRTNTLPKLNMKFPIGKLKDAKWAEAGFPGIGERMDKSELATYKYHIDIGGGGGTTWTGTMDKLKMPGLLFHHKTVAKDYIHDDIQPWVHYVPVEADLSDLMEKLEWAESHQAEAREIAENATRLMNKLSEPEGFEELFVQHMIKPLVKVIEAYQPMNLRNDVAWSRAFQSLGGDQWTPLIECTAHDGCQKLEGTKKYDDRDPTHTPLGQLKWGGH